MKETNLFKRSRKPVTLKSIRLQALMLSIFSLLLVGNVSAQSYDYVTVYQHCDFKGESQRLRVGKHSNLGRLSIGNDRISSIRVPQGVQVMVYSDSKFRGDYVTYDRSEACLPEYMNDKISSLTVSYNDRNNAQTREDYRDRRNNNQDNAYQDRRYNDRDASYQGRYRGRYRDRNQNSNDYQRSIEQRSTSRIANRCFTYRAYARGGQGGIKFHQHKDATRHFGDDVQSGQICHDGSLTMELIKTQAATEVVAEIDGKRYIFAANEQEDTYLNTWYRKMFKFKVNR